MISHRFSLAAAAAALAALPLAGPGLAQGIGPQTSTVTSPIPHPASVTLQARITAINPETRAVTLTGANGNTVTITAGPLVRLENLKVGDTVNAQYDRAVAFLVSGPGETIPDDTLAAAAARNPNAPGGGAVSLLRISATVVGIDLDAHSVDLVNPTGGGVLTVVVTDPRRIALLETLKVGDTVTAAVTEALAVSITPAPKSWF